VALRQEVSIWFSVSSPTAQQPLQRTAAAVILALAFIALAPALHAEGAPSLDSITMTVSDLDASTAFYEEVLGFRRVSSAEVAGDPWERLYGTFALRIRFVRLALGSEAIELREFLAPRGHPIPDDARSNDRSFQHVAIIVSDMEAAYARLREHGVRHASSGPQRLPDWNPNAGGIEAFYFRDPDGHPLEILRFPAGKGEARWQARESLFLGIDHTAIVVDNTDASLAFYRDVLGFRVAGESLNFGAEQEHLNNVRGARLRITGLRASAGPGVEFLEYLAPTDGRPFPADEQANDLVHWQTTILVPNAAAAAGVVRRGRFRLVSPGAVTLPDTSLGFRRGLRVRDPDGHVVQLVEQ
jgi:catechol 2,3-dioxygenase-like lactoylglutathione lyase family enzyme